MTCARSAVEKVKTVITDARLGGLKSIGVTAGNSLEILVHGQSEISVIISELQSVYRTALESYLAAEVTA
jgi:hypothetical protein